MATILCVDDEPAVGVALDHFLRRLGHQPIGASSVDEAMAAAVHAPLDLVIADYRMPGHTGLDLLERLAAAGHEVPVIIMTGHASIEHAVESIRSGAIDYLTKPVSLETLDIAVGKALQVAELKRENEALRRELARATAGRTLIGESAPFRAALDVLAAVAPTRATVLLEGESGTGKELFARALHEQSPRRDGPFVAINCAALPEGLVESTLFGHERGAFTGASSRVAGAFERASGGTLLLDEVSEMRLDLQAKVLRVVQEQEFERVGGTTAVRVDVRIVATTNRDLAAEVAAGRFRSDLYYRLNVVTIRTPPLRERRDDIPRLVRRFLQQAAARHELPTPSIAADAMETILAHDWPGNVRQLANALERAVILAGGREILRADLELHPGAVRSEGDADVLDLDELERRAIARALAATGGNRVRAARLLGISDRTLRKKLNTPPDDSSASAGR
jgi:DNA-binding NtrC family response regulator